MIIFDQLRISDDGNRLYVNAHVNGAKMFDKVSIRRLKVCQAEKASETNPMQTPDDCMYVEEFEEGTREINVAVKALEMKNYPRLNFSGDLIFVYVECEASSFGDGCVPCRLDEPVTVGVTFDDKLLWQRVMAFTGELAGNCRIPYGFIDFILLWNAFKAAVETEHYVPALKYWKMLFGGLESHVYAGGGCGCHG